MQKTAPANVKYPSIYGGTKLQHESTRKELELYPSHDKNEGAWRSGEGGEEPA